MFLSAFAACTDESATISSGELKEIVVNADHFVSETDSRAFYLSGNSVEFKWADGDTIGIFPNEGAQAYFPILTTDEASSSASFTGGGWALKPSSTYAAYYPFIGKFYINKNEVPISYVGQKQTDNSSMEHLSAYDFMAASASTPQSGLVNFQLKHLGSFVQLKITMPQGGTLSSVTLSADEALFVTKGTMDVMATAPTIKAVETSKTLTLDVENVTTTAENPVATLYMMLAPVDFTGKTLSAIVKTSDGRSETITLTNKNFEAGKAYAVSGAMKDPNGGVTAGDGTYKNGVVSIDVAGNMKKLLGSDYLNITELKVVGPINGDDIYYLRKMLGGSNFSEADWGKLTTLDLSEATIVEGGGWYYSQSSFPDYYGDIYTSNNTIGGFMFCECYNLEKIILPDNVTSIEGYAFYYSEKLSSVTIGKNVTSIKSEAFYECLSLSSINIPDNVVSIGARAFFNSGITSAIIGNGVISIENSAFYGCKNLITVKIGNSVETIGDNVFEECEKLQDIIIPNNVYSIGQLCFSKCKSLKSIKIGTSLKEIGAGTFNLCSLESVYITDLKTWCVIDFKTAYGVGYSYSNPLYNSNLFLNEELITDLILPEGMSISEGAFYGCKSLVNVTADKIESIGSSAFAMCNALSTINVCGNGNATIDSSAFGLCQSLISVNIGDGVTSIGPYVFSGCEKLSVISIGKNVKSIAEGAFESTSISKFCSYVTTPPSIKYYTSADSFSDAIMENAVLYVPVRCGSEYKLSPWGNVFTNIVEMD